MLQECQMSDCQTKFSMENFRKRSQCGQQKRYKHILKASFKDFNIPTGSWDRTKWRCFINKRAAQFEAKRICEAKRKRKELKERAKGSSSDSAQSELTCSICNRQHRTTIGLSSHQRTHTITHEHSLFRT